MKTQDLASNMEGKELENGWRVVEKMTSRAGCFSSGYRVVNAEIKREGFLKVLNYEYAFTQKKAGEMSSDFMARTTNEFNYERDLYKYCEDYGIKSVVKSIESGEYGEDGYLLTVPYIIMEFAKGGSLESDSRMKQLDLLWRLEMFHCVTKAVKQLHQGGVAHKDLHAGNLLLDKDIGTDRVKIGDLGRADRKTEIRNMYGKVVTWPYELYYGDVREGWDWSVSYDCFSLGCLLYNLFTDISITAGVLNKVDPGHRPCFHGGTWSGGYRDVLPYIEVAFYERLDLFKKSILEVIDDVRFADKVVGLVKGLCHPDPRLRSHENNRKSVYGGTDYSLDRVLTDADWLVKKARLSK